MPSRSSRTPGTNASGWPPRLPAKRRSLAAMAEQWEAEEANRDMLIPTTSHGDFVWYGPHPIIVS